MESDFDVLGVAKNLMKYVVHLFKIKIKIKNNSLHTRCSNNKLPDLGLKEF
jgi:hypothetical protein